MKNLKRGLLIVLVMTAFSANAQFKFGVAGGLNVSKFSNENSLGVSNALGLNAGLICEIKLPAGIGFEADLLYSEKGSSFEFASFNELIRSEHSLKYIDIPVVAKIYLFKVTNIQLGLQYSHLIGARHHLGKNAWDVKDQFDFADLSVVLGLGIDANRIHFSARYNYGVLGGFSGGDTQINMLTFSVGLWIKN